MKSEFEGNIIGVRAVEDSIRATRMFAEKMSTMRKRHPDLHQGEGFASQVFVKHYEVYPGTEIHWDMPAGKAIDWLWGQVPQYEVRFWYHYRDNRATVRIYGGQKAIGDLSKSIPGFTEALAAVVASSESPPEPKMAVQASAT